MLNNPLIDQNENPYQYNFPSVQPIPENRIPSQAKFDLASPTQNAFAKTNEYRSDSSVSSQSNIVYVPVRPNTGETENCNACCCLKCIGLFMLVNFVLSTILIAIKYA